VRELTAVRHRWRGLFGHCHHTTRVDTGVTSLGVSAPLRVGCHCLAMAGKREASEWPLDARCPAQKGHPLPRTTRS
jgi:hypothetical protein